MRAGDTVESLHERIKAGRAPAVPGDGGPGARAAAAAGRPVGRSGPRPAAWPTQERAGVRALLSVYDKTGLVDLARGLSDLGIGSWWPAATPPPRWTPPGIAHRQVAEVTGVARDAGRPGQDPAPPHPRRASWPTASKPEHLADLAAHGIEPIDLVVCNLYPFSLGPLGRAHRRRGPDHGARGGQELRPRGRGHLARRLPGGAGRAGRATARCRPPPGAGWPGPPSPTPRPTTRPSWPGSTGPSGRGERTVARAGGRCRRTAGLPATLQLTLERAEVLRYGENPHQHGARYRVAGEHHVVGRRGPARRHGPLLPQPLRRRRGLAPGPRAGRRRRRAAGGGHHQARQPLRGGGGRRPGRPPTSGPSSATPSRPSAASWPSGAR